MQSKFQHRKPQKAGRDRSNLTGIPTQMKLDFEQLSGMSFDDVRVHYNSEKPAQFQALAYTQGAQIYIGPGQERSLPHELGHVIQQKAGRVRPTRWVRGQPVNDQPELEREADRAPIQCLAAPALWGVIQMALPILPRQRGNNCGYHALARAIYALYPNKFPSPFDENNLELQLTTYAIKNKYSVVGEAFDPFILAKVGNAFCRNDPFCIKNNISIQCTVLAFNENTMSRIQTRIQRDVNSGNSIFLVPYFPNTRTRILHRYFAPTNSGGEQNAHWSVIGPGDGNNLFELCEGNFRGSANNGYVGDSLGVTLNALLASNMSINPEFNWDNFRENTSLFNINRKELAVNMNSRSFAFQSPADFDQRVVNVMKNIRAKSRLSPYSGPNSLLNHIQKVQLRGHVIKVTT